MDILSTELTYAQEAYAKAGDAQKLLNGLIKLWRYSPFCGELFSYDQLKKADDGILAFMRTMTETATLLDRRIKERRAKWENAPVLEAVIRCGDLTRKIVIAKPNDRISEPFVTESFLTAIRNKWKTDEVITTDEDYDILVINRKGKTVAVIERN